ncbi:S41 family peptidase [Tenacibaculum maritimum]|uniref:S41 family peptidase n=1 Tax=Tenacibaculum maritimum TaxID=107401 RepID=UPI00388E8688
MKLIQLPLFILTVLFVFSCDKKEAVPANVEIQSFVWKGLNAYYLWQEEIEELSDRRFTSDQQLFNYLQGYENPANLFENLLYERGITDKWSWIVDDYIALEQAFQGTTETTGMEFGLNSFINDSSKLFGYVRYVVTGTDAENKGITRGMLFTEVNGTQITKNNYRNLLFSKENSYTITLANYNNGSPITNGTTITLNKSQYTENPIHKSTIFNEGGKKIGYLMYNSFTTDFDDELNNEFATFKNEGITDLIIDLRYNGGGSVRTATYLASMITGQFNNQVFASQRWNKKIMDHLNTSNFTNNFTDKIDNGIVTQTIHSVGLENIYFITTNSSASASELLINGLASYINVKQVGTKTHGKYVGSVTLYDSPNYTRKDANPNHNWAMQPIVLEIVNKDGTNSKDGFSPTVELPENFGNLGILGDRNEPLLERTISLITTGSKGFSSLNVFDAPKEFSNSKLHTPTRNNMYVELK